MTLLAIDAGTTHVKAGLYGLDGTPVAVAGRPNVTYTSAAGQVHYRPEALWAAVEEAVARVLDRLPPGRPVAALGLGSMAETGLLLDRAGGRALTPFFPWFDTGPAAHAAVLERSDDPLQRFRRTGLRASHKCGLARLLWLRDDQGADLCGATWLSVADYLLYRLTGQVATEPSLAVRTLAFDLEGEAWDTDWLRTLGLDAALFPPVRPDGTVAGRLTAPWLGLAAGTPVVLAGHDQVCAALGAGAGRPGTALDAMGTAEVLLGALPQLTLGQAQFESGLLYGRHAVPGCHYWLGSLSMSGGAVDWLRRLLARADDGEPLSYEALAALVEAGGDRDPTGILFYPYLAGSGAPHLDAGARAEFVGLGLGHGRAELARAVLEGTAFEAEVVRRAAEAATGEALDELVAAGGGTRLRPWLQIKADVAGLPVRVRPQPEATLLGAALLAGAAVGAVDSAAEAVSRLNQQEPGPVYRPDPARHRAYRALFEEQYAPRLALTGVFNGDGNDGV